MSANTQDIHHFPEAAHSALQKAERSFVSCAYPAKLPEDTLELLDLLNIMDEAPKATDIFSCFAEVNRYLDEASEYASAPCGYEQLKLSAVDLRAMHTRLAAKGFDREFVTQAGQDKDRQRAAWRYIHFAENLPSLPNQKVDFIEGVFTPDVNGFAPLDNPRIWNDSTCKLLLKEVVQKGCLLTKETARHGRVVDVLLHGLPAKEVISTLNENGVFLRSDALLDEARKPSFLLQAIVAAPGGVNALFTRENWTGAAQEMKQVYSALPVERRPDNGMSLFVRLNTAVGPNEQGRGR